VSFGHNFTQSVNDVGSAVPAARPPPLILREELFPSISPRRPGGIASPSTSKITPERRRPAITITVRKTSGAVKKKTNS